MNCSRTAMVVLGAAIVLGVVAKPGGHTPIASRWNYNEHLFPVFRDRCGSCHIEGGVAPMSLVDYQSAYPWAQAIREEVLGLRMPPWQAEDGYGDFKNGHVLAPQEMDMILEWSAGGYPQGPRNQSPELPILGEDWTLGEPTVTLEMPVVFTVAANVGEVIRYFVLPTDNERDRVVTGVDFRPGAPAVVRGASIFVDNAGVARGLDAADLEPGFAPGLNGEFPTHPPIAVWTPGQQSVLNEGVGYPLPSGADIVVRIHYRKTWITEGAEFSDRSRIGLHLSQGKAATLQTRVVTSPVELVGPEAKFAYPVGQDALVLSLFPEVDIESSDLQITGVLPDGSRVPMLWLRDPDNGWPTRFWFDAPVELPAGSELEVTARMDSAAERSPRATLLGDGRAPIRFSVDYLARKSTAAN